MAEPILSVEDLSCGFHTEEGYTRVVDGVSYALDAGTTLGLVGESGCGKTVSALAVMGLLPRPAGVMETGEIRLHGRPIAGSTQPLLKSVRGRQISMIFQEPMTALNPVHRIGKQLLETIELYEPELGRAAQQARAIELVEQVGIPAPGQRRREYPHQLSGGMRQRVMIAMALSGNPQVLIADEPTTALDVTIQAQILELLVSLQRAHGMAVIFITHDLGVVAQICDEVLVMYAGRIAERASARQLFGAPRHPYTHGLIHSIPQLDTPLKSPLPTIEGVVPALNALPPGCRFSNRCRYADQRCAAEVPALRPCQPRHEVACHHWRRLAA
ncbi:MAG: ABC transporter ATP-binding protein [Rhodospirillaceae bacterium]|nr:ABC transporter ATP-binding protein [Rhodospirillaceae bacterium]